MQLVLMELMLVLMVALMGPSSNTRSKTSAGVATESHPLKDAEVIEINTTGIHPPPGKEFLVIFHVLIPLFAWDSKNYCI